MLERRWQPPWPAALSDGIRAGVRGLCPLNRPYLARLDLSVAARSARSVAPKLSVVRRLRSKERSPTLASLIRSLKPAWEGGGGCLHSPISVVVGSFEPPHKYLPVPLPRQWNPSLRHRPVLGAPPTEFQYPKLLGSPSRSSGSLRSLTSTPALRREKPLHVQLCASFGAPY